jgi:hypothetical protein
MVRPLRTKREEKKTSSKIKENDENKEKVARIIRCQR